MYLTTMTVVNFWATAKCYKNIEKGFAFLDYYVAYVHRHRNFWHFKTGRIGCS